MDDQELSGWWWLLEDPDRRVSGTLSISAKGRSELKLIGALRPRLRSGKSTTANGTTTTVFTEESMQEGGTYPRIHGRVGDKSLTLEDCFQTRLSGSLFDDTLAEETIHVNQVFHGIWLEEGEARAFSKASVRMDWLAYWVGKSGLREKTSFSNSEGGGYRSSSVTLERIPTEEFQGSDGAVITLGQSFSVKGDGIVERRFAQDFYFQVSYEEAVDLTRLMEQVGDLQDLVSMGVGRSAGFAEVTLRHPDIERPMGDGKVHEEPIGYFAQWQAVSTNPTKSLMPHEMLFTLEDLGGVDGIERWLRVAAIHRSALGRLMATQYSKGMYLSDRLMNCAAALEAYDRDKHGDGKKKVDYIDRIRRCASWAGSPFAELVGHPEAWARAMKNARVVVAHHRSRLQGASTEHLFLSETAYWLFTMCLLRDSEAPEAVYERMLENPKRRWLHRGIVEVLQQPKA